MTESITTMTEDLQEIFDRVWDDSEKQHRPVHEIMTEVIAEYIGSLPESEREEERRRITRRNAYRIIKWASRFDEMIAGAETEEERAAYMKLQEKYRQWLWYGPLFCDERMLALEMVVDEYIERLSEPGEDDEYSWVSMDDFQELIGGFWEEVGEKPAAPAGATKRCSDEKD